MMGLACLFMVACNNTPKQEQKPEEPQQEVVAQEEHHCPFCSLKAEYAKWDDMEEADRVALNNKAIAVFAEMDAKKAECEANGEHQCQHEMAEMSEEQKAECEAKCAEMKALMEQWANIETLTNDEQKDLVLARIAAMGMGGKCEKDGEEKGCCNQAAE